MSDELFGERRRALEEAFFRKQDAEGLAEMRAKRQSEHMKDALRETAGITNEPLLSHLVSVGLTPETLVAAAVAPLVAVAWADGKLEEAERNQILREAHGLDLGDEALILLEHWLAQEPEPSLFETWTEYIQSLLPRLDESARAQLKATTHARAVAVAEAAAGEPYGVGRQISLEEQSVLRRINAPFES